MPVKLPIVKRKPVRLQGNMLIMVALSIFMLMLVVALGMSIQYCFFSNKNLQFSSDQFTVGLATNLNCNDRIGQMNNIVVSSRELIFNSKNTDDNINQNAPQLALLANNFLTESIQGADLVERARSQQITLIIGDVRNAIKQTTLIGNTGPPILPWAKSSEPEITNVRLGSIEQVESNVQGPYGNSGLLSLDTEYGYIDPISHLYFGNCILRLPGITDRQFSVASLPAPVNLIVAPVKLTSATVFHEIASIFVNGSQKINTCSQLPSAVQVDIQMPIANRVLFEIKDKVKVGSTAATNGALSLAL